MPLVLDGLVLTYDISRLNAVDVTDSEQTFISSNIIGPNGIAFDPSGNVYVSNSASNSISKFDSAGTFFGAISNNVNRPFGVLVDAADNPR